MCCICLADIDASDSADGMLRCNHPFHARCLRTWFKTASNCPVCRGPMRRYLHDLPNRALLDAANRKTQWTLVGCGAVMTGVLLFYHCIRGPMPTEAHKPHQWLVAVVHSAAILSAILTLALGSIFPLCRDFLWRQMHHSIEHAPDPARTAEGVWRNALTICSPIQLRHLSASWCQSDFIVHSVCVGSGFVAPSIRHLRTLISYLPGRRPFAVIALQPPCTNTEPLAYLITIDDNAQSEYEEVDDTHCVLLQSACAATPDISLPFVYRASHLTERAIQAWVEAEQVSTIRVYITLVPHTTFAGRINWQIILFHRSMSLVDVLARVQAQCGTREPTGTPHTIHVAA
jgi:hypothetical protein